MEAEMKIYQVSLVVLALAMILSACGGGGSSSNSSSDPVAVLEALETAWNAKDIDAVMALIADDAVETEAWGVTLTDRDKIRELYNTNVMDFSMDCKNYNVVGNTVTYECLIKDYIYSDTTHVGYEAVIEKGKIKSRKFMGVTPNP
jgi:hypothetical protein